MKFYFASVLIILVLIAPVLSVTKHKIRHRQAQPGYTYYQGLDSGGNDIRNVPGQNVDQLKDICNKDPTCVGFNTNGWVKNKLVPQSQWYRWSNNANEGFYVKNSCGQSQYTFYQGLDSGGNDIKNVAGQTVDQLKDICNKEPTCVGFNTNGWVKNKLVPQSQWYRWSNNANEGFYVKTNPTYTYYQGVDSGGNDIKNVPGQTVDQLKDICNQDPTCVGFNTNGWVKNNLVPQSQWYRWSNNANQGFYVKNTCIQAPQYTFYQGVDSGGNDIKNVAGQTVDQLKDICNKEPTCVAFNTNGWVKNKLVPQSQWYRWSNNANEGLYVKKTS